MYCVRDLWKTKEKKKKEEKNQKMQVIPIQLKMSEKGGQTKGVVAQTPGMLVYYIHLRAGHRTYPW
jgi:hypothetical protein